MGGLCVLGSTGLLVKMIVVPGAMIVFAFATNSGGSPLFCARMNRAVTIATKDENKRFMAISVQFTIALDASNRLRLSIL